MTNTRSTANSDEFDLDDDDVSSDNDIEDLTLEENGLFGEESD